MSTSHIRQQLGLMLRSTVVLVAAMGSSIAWGQVTVTTTAELVNAVNSGEPGTTVNVAAGTYALPSTLRLKNGMSIIGAGAGQTIIQNAPGFAFPVAAWYDADVNFEFSNPNAYLIDLGRDQANLSVRNVTLTGPQVYGGIHYIACNNVTISGVEFVNFRWSGIRGFIGDNITITNNRFLDAGGQTVNGDGSFGTTGGSLFISYMGLSVIDNNRFERTGTRLDNVFGVKGREFRNTRISNNTIRCDFAIELPFENDYYVDIENNYLDGVLSVPRFAGGLLPPTGANPYTFRIRNNYFTKSYSIEGPHNGMIVERNVFDFPVDSDYGNLFSTFDPGSETPAAPGPLDFNNNIVINPGRGVFWSDAVWNNLSFTNNHIQADEIVASEFPEGFFSFRDSSPAMGGQLTNYNTITIANNVVEIFGQSRNLIRHSSAYAANISNNQLINVADASTMTNPQTGALRGLVTPLNFNVGVNGEFNVNGNALLLRAVPCSIVIQPTGDIICAGGSASIAVGASGPGPLTYQWRKGSVNVDTTTNPTAATSTLTLTSLIITDSGSYDCVVTNACGSVTSNAATLTVLEASDSACISCPACPADYNKDGGVTGDDVSAFFADYEAGTGCADANVDGGITGDDIAAFFGVYEAGGC